MNAYKLGFVLAGAALCIPAAVYGSASAIEANSAPSPAQTTAIQNTATAAVIAWQTAFIEQSQVAALAPDLVKPIATAMTQANANEFFASATKRLSTLFAGEPLQVLTRSLDAEVQASGMSLASPVTGAANPAGGSNGYAICVAGGASDFKFTSVSVDGSNAHVDLTAYAWTSLVDFLPGKLPRVDTAAAPSVYHLDLSQDATGAWMVTRFDAAPVSE